MGGGGGGWGVLQHLTQRVFVTDEGHRSKEQPKDKGKRGRES